MTTSCLEKKKFSAMLLSVGPSSGSSWRFACACSQSHAFSQQLCAWACSDCLSWFASAPQSCLTAFQGQASCSSHFAVLPPFALPHAWAQPLHPSCSMWGLQRSTLPTRPTMLLHWSVLPFAKPPRCTVATGDYWSAQNRNGCRLDTPRHRSWIGVF